MDTVLNFLHSMALSTSNKQWLADHLYEEVKAFFVLYILFHPLSLLRRNR